MTDKDKIIIYTDGCSLGNPGPGGFGAVMRKGKYVKEFSGGYRFTTNNRMEIYAAIFALTQIKAPNQTVEIYSDSRLLVDSVSKGWLYNWQNKGWKKSDRKPVLNQDLWQLLLPLLKQHKVTFHWVEGHAGIPDNERCDILSKDAAASNKDFIDEFYEKENSQK